MAHLIVEMVFVEISGASPFVGGLFGGRRLRLRAEVAAVALLRAVLVPAGPGAALVVDLATT
jgi:hypothetical protein